MNNNNIEEQQNEQAGYQVLVSSLSWKEDSTMPYRSKYSEKRGLPDQIPFDIPKGVLDQARKSGRFEDTIESYVYNALTYKYGHEVQHCQIWLPEE